MERINVTRSIMPRPGEYEELTRNILASHVLTNNGPTTVALEGRIAKFLGLEEIALCANGTVGIEIALHAAGCAGKKIITTPFTYVATASAAMWVGCDVIFADIDADTLCLSPTCVREKMAADIVGVMPVNIYGHCCDDMQIRNACGDAPIIYDAAQAFGAKLNGRSLLDFGDFAVCSLHATKVFHTVEGGFVVCHNIEDQAKLRLLRAFGHINDKHFCLGINAKISELHAAMGLCVLERFNEQLAARRSIDEFYRSELKPGPFRYPATPSGFESNYGYFPVVLDNEELLLRMKQKLSEANIFPRRYFYPALTTLPYVRNQSCPVAEDISRRVLCLPIYGDLAIREAEKIAHIFNRTMTGANI